LKLLILYTKDTQEIFNRKSAIGSYINCLGGLLNSSNVEVYLNGLTNSEMNRVESSNRIVKQSKLSFVKKLIPKVVKRFVMDKKHVKLVEDFKNKLMASPQKYDAILEFYNLGSNVGMEMSKKLDIPLYITYDGPIVEEYEFFNGGKPFGLKEILRKEKESLIQASKIVVYSNPMKSFVKNITGIHSNIFIHQNVDFTRFDVFNDNKDVESSGLNICFIGSFLKWHNVEMLVDAFESVIKKGLNANLFLIGDGVERVKIQSHVKKLPIDLQSKIKFTGFLDGDKLFEVKKKMHIGVMPGSNWYGAPNKIFEYGAMNMAVLAPNTPTILDLFTDDEVLFFKWKNQPDLNNSLFKIIEDKLFRNGLAKSLNNLVSIKYTESNTKEFYSNLLDLKR